DRGELDKAEAELKRALAIDPNYAPATTLMAEVGRLMNKRSAEVENIAQAVEQRDQARIQQHKLKAQQRFADGQRYLDSSEYDKAMCECEGVVNIINWTPYVGSDPEFVELKSRTEQALEQARAGKRNAEQAAHEKAAEDAYQKLRDEEAREDSRRQDRVAVLFEEAEKSFARGDYEGAETLADRILEIDPQNPQAQDMKRTAQEARHRAVDEQTLSLKKERYKIWREEIEKAKIAQSQVLKWAPQDEWDMVAGRETSAGRDLTDTATQEINNQLRSQLKTRQVNLQFEDSPLPPVIEFIRSLSGINIVIDPEVKNDLDGVTIPGSLSLNNISVEYALNILLSYAPDVTYTFREGVVFITKKAKAFGKTVVRLHDIRDISFGVTAFTSPDLNLAIAGKEKEGT